MDNKDFEIAKGIWDDYHKKLHEYESRLRKDVLDLCNCFKIPKQVLEEAKSESSRQLFSDIVGETKNVRQECSEKQSV